MKDTIHDDQTDSIPRMQGWFHVREIINALLMGKRWGRVGGNMSISIDVEKTFLKAQHHFMIFKKARLHFAQ